MIEATSLLQQNMKESVPADFFEEASFAEEPANVHITGDFGLGRAESENVARSKVVSAMQSGAHQSDGLSQREASCRSFLGTWAARGTVSLALVCREAFGSACAAAEDALGGDWPEVSAAMPAQDVAAIACGAVEKKLQSSRGLMLSQLASERHASEDLPDWIKEAPVIMEDAERSEWPAPVNEFPATWEGPALTPSGMAAQAALAANASAGADSATVD